MRIHFSRIIFLILPYSLIFSQPLRYQENQKGTTSLDNVYNVRNDNAQHTSKHSELIDENEQIISVRITSSVAVGRTNGKMLQQLPDKPLDRNIFKQNNSPVEDVGLATATTEFNDYISSTFPTTITEEIERITDLPQSFDDHDKELDPPQFKKGTRGVNQFEHIHSFQWNENTYNNTDDFKPTAETYITDDNIEDVPLARSIPLSYSSKNYFQDSTQSSQNSHKLTTVNFNVLHDTQKLGNYNRHNSYDSENQAVENSQVYYNEPSKIYSQPAKIYSEPAKFYSEPSKIYSEPSKIYSEPAKIYSEPAKIYSEPAKFYSQPASLHYNPHVPPMQPSWKHPSDATVYSSTVSTSPTTLITNTPQDFHRHHHQMHPERNYEVDEKESVMSDGRSHGVQPSNSENCKQDNCKVGYVVEGRQFRKYRVEERTSDGFLVGEYGVVRNEDGALRGVRYTADSEASPRLIHDALMKFLQLKR